MEMLHYNFLAVRWTKSVQTQRVYLMRNLDLRRTSAPDLCTETASPFHRDWNFLWQNSLIQSAWPVSGHTCLAAHSRTSIKSLEDMSWKDLFCVTRVFPLLAHRAFRFPVKFIQLCHHAISGCLRSCLTSQYFRKWGQPSARPLGRNSELEKFQKCLFFACAKKKKNYPLFSSVIIPLLSNLQPVFRNVVIILRNGCNAITLNYAKWYRSEMLETKMSMKGTYSVDIFRN